MAEVADHLTTKSRSKGPGFDSTSWPTICNLFYLKFSYKKGLLLQSNIKYSDSTGAFFVFCRFEDLLRKLNPM